MLRSAISSSLKLVCDLVGADSLPLYTNCNRGRITLSFPNYKRHVQTVHHRQRSAHLRAQGLPCVRLLPYIDNLLVLLHLRGERLGLQCAPVDSLHVGCLLLEPLLYSTQHAVSYNRVGSCSTLLARPGKDKERWPHADARGPGGPPAIAIGCLIKTAQGANEKDANHSGAHRPQHTCAALQARQEPTMTAA